MAMADASERVRWFASLRGLKASWLPGDAIAALTLAAIAIPEQLATARLVGMPPMCGLLAFAAGSLAFATFGTNRLMSVGADSTIAPIMAATLAGMAAVGTPHYTSLIAALALLVGIVLLLCGPLRLGWIADLLSIPVTTGFLAGVSVHIIVGQLPTVLGVTTARGSPVHEVAELVRQLSDANPYSASIGFGVLVLCLLSERINHRIPGALLALVLSGLAVWQLDLAHRGVRTLGALPMALPARMLTIPSWSEFTHLLPLSLVVALVCVIQTAAVVQSFPSGSGANDSVDRDFAAVGAGSILAALLGSFAVNSSPPRTAVVAESGGRSQLCGLLAIGIVAALVLVAANAFAYVPHAALSGVLVFIGMRIFHIPAMRRIYQRSPWEILLVVASVLWVVTMPIAVGVSMSIVLSLLQSIYIIARPRCSELARVPGTTVWWTQEKEKTGEHEAGVLVFALGAPLNFINARYLIAKMRRSIATQPSPCRLVVIESSGVIDIDFTGSQLLQKAVDDLRGHGIDVAVARLESERASRAAERTGLIDVISTQNVFRSVEEAIRQHKVSPTPGA